MGKENTDRRACLGWSKSEGNTFWAQFDLGMGEENVDRDACMEWSKSGGSPF